MKLLVDVAKLEADGTVTPQQALQIHRAAAADTGTLAINVIATIGAFAVVAGLLAMRPTSAQVAVIGLGLTFAGALIRKFRQNAARFPRLFIDRDRRRPAGRWAHPQVLGPGAARIELLVHLPSDAEVVRAYGAIPGYLGVAAGCRRREFDFWTMGEAARLARLTGLVEGIAAGARRVFKRIESRSIRIRPGDEVAPGIVAIDTAGHTPGHISLLITGRDKLLITADAIQNAHVAFAHPNWRPRADMDGDQAATKRRQMLDMAATDNLRVLCYHIPFPGLGRVERKGSVFTWPADI